MGAAGTILICGFGPFPGVPRNPSETAARDLARLRRPLLGALHRHVEILPTRWDALPHLADTLRSVRPDAVLLLGVAARRRVVNVEMRAVNVASAFPDAARRHAPQRAVQPGGPDVRVTRACVPHLVHKLRQAGLKAAPSRDAGRYLCNGAYFTALSVLAEARVPVVFVHLPGRAPGARAGRLRRANGLAQLLNALKRDPIRLNQSDG
ncbi:peptidase C15 [Aquabacter sp. L1I39]|uniref:pyroglutamyl-peptidase I family protein n=1 Tax=Aquabacter sp. L1I39 TaxID=2820278 RepID=UPI001AD9B9A4|nr:peptidase C15 [Aquabacter sp. L1I39]QTL02361.1 peptidase C15 [Aquabacter sp. L1I39]